MKGVGQVYHERGTTAYLDWVCDLSDREHPCQVEAVRAGSHLISPVKSTREVCTTCIHARACTHACFTGGYELLRRVTSYTDTPYMCQGKRVLAAHGPKVAPAIAYQSLHMHSQAEQEALEIPAYA